MKRPVTRKEKWLIYIFCVVTALAFTVWGGGSW
jgi:hypothetical protein